MHCGTAGGHSGTAREGSQCSEHEAKEGNVLIRGAARLLQALNASHGLHGFVRSHSQARAGTSVRRGSAISSRKALQRAASWQEPTASTKGCRARRRRPCRGEPTAARAHERAAGLTAFYIRKQQSSVALSSNCATGTWPPSPVSTLRRNL